jgi:molybdopterin/thiamine biosynthesis adenylyltransferase
LLSSPSTLGVSKAVAAARRIADVNPAVDVRVVDEPFTLDRADALVAGVAVTVDALDSVEMRLTLAAGCAKLGIPLVSGTIAGWFGYVTTVFPGERTLERLYSRFTGGRGIEADLGNPSFTPAAVASLQVAETVKVLLGTGALLRNKVLCVNLLDMEIESVTMEVPPATGP